MQKHEEKLTQTKEDTNKIRTRTRSRIEKWKRNDLFKTIINVEQLYQGIIKKLSMKTVNEALAHTTTYTISGACKTHMLEFELKRARALAEAQRHRLL